MIERNSSALARELRRVKHALFTFLFGIDGVIYGES